jgi:predicted kinase
LPRQSEMGAMLIIIYGLPGAGKTVIARMLSRRLAARYIASDDIWNAVYTRPIYSKEESDVVFSKLLEEIINALSSACGALVIEGVFASTSRIRKLEEICKKKNVKIFRILVAAPLQALLDRTSIRAHPISIEKLAWLTKSFETQTLADLTLNTDNLTLNKLESEVDKITAQLLI